MTETFYCGVCYEWFEKMDGITTNSSLDYHIETEHGINTHQPIATTSQIEEMQQRQKQREF